MGRHLLHSGRNLIGRLSDNDIVLDDTSVSRQHAAIEISNEGATIVDLGSRNGTSVSGEKISPEVPIPIAHDGRIQIGAYHFRFLTQPAAPAPGPEVQAEKPTGEQPIEEENLKFQPQAEEPLPEAPPPRPALGEAPRAPRVRMRTLLLFGIAAVLFVVAGFQVYRFLGRWMKREEGERKTTAPVERPGEVGGVLPPVQEPTVVPKEKPIFLEFSSSPIPAKISFGSREIGETPFRVSTKLEEGKWYEVKGIFPLSDIGETAEEVVRFQAKPGADVIPIQFQGKIGIFKVTSLPRGGQLYIEGYFEKDPFRGKPVKFGEVVFGKPVYVPHGRYVVEVRQSRQLEGSQTFVDQVIYRREFRLDLDHTSYTLDVNEGDLTVFPVEITSVPTGVKVFVDEKEVGVTPFSGLFPIGEHLLILRREGYFDYSQVVKMDINTPFATEIRLKTSEAGELVNRATEMIRGDRHAEALPLLVEAYTKNPSPRENAEISYLIGVCYLKKGSYKEAEDYFNKARSHPDFRHHGRLGLANLSFIKGNPVGALQLLVEVLVEAEDPKVRQDAGALFQQITPLKSVLYVASEPTGAQVFVNHRPIAQRTPLILHELNVGTYRIEVKKEGYNPGESKVDVGVSEFRPVVIKLNPVQ